MLNVSQAVKTAYANPSSGKEIIIYFPELDITVDPDTIYSESFTLSESIMDLDSIEFVGCNPSKMQVQIQDFGESVKGQRVQVSVITEDTENEPVPLFDGIVDTVTQQSNKRIKELVAYDLLYSKGNTDIAQWYITQFTNYWQDGVTLKDFRDELFDELDIDVEEITLVNDTLFFEKQFSPVNMKALDIIKYICQINGVFGIMNRDNKFEFRAISPIQSESAIAVGIYKEIDYQEFTVKPVDKLTIRPSDMEPGVTVGTGTNNYIVQGNFFTFNLEDEDVQTAAENLYPLISGIVYIPYKVTQVAYPWIECGDVVSYQVYDFEASQQQGEDVYTTMYFYVFERYIKGIQAFRDEYEAQGEEYQTVFVTTVDAQIETIKNQIESLVGKLNSLQLNYIMFYNESAVDVGDGETRPVANIQFAVAKEGQVRIDLEYLIECETTEEETSAYITNNDLEVTLFYEYDGNIIDSREPQETYQDGRHILSTFYILNVDNTTMHSWKVWLKCMGGSVHIDLLKAQNTILGIGISGREEWDGLIEITDRMSPISIVEILVAELTDNAIVTLLDPARISPVETMSSQDIDSISVVTLTDNCGIDRVITNAWVDETTKNQMTYNHTFVVIDNHNFVLATEFTSVSTSQVIDSGYCTKVTPTTNGLATIERVTIVCNS